VETGDLPVGETSPVLELRVEGSSVARTSDMTQEPGGFKGSFGVEPGERRIELRLRGGSPLILRRLTLAPAAFGVHEERRAGGEDR
jgi:hypothetical protein